jgi:hypothetical protein
MIYKFDRKIFNKLKKSKNFEFILTGNFNVLDGYIWFEVIISGDNDSHLACKMSESGECLVLPINIKISDKDEELVYNFLEQLTDNAEFKSFYNNSFAEFQKFPRTVRCDIYCHQFRMLQERLNGERYFLGSFYIDEDENKIVRTEEAYE